VGDTPAESAVAPAVSGGAPPSPLAHLRLLLIALGGALALIVMAGVAYEMARARVPQHRAALEELIRHETGLEISFGELYARWGWYGPEAVFEGVELGEPHEPRSLLRAERLIVGLDLWRMARSGQLEAGRITLVSADIDASERAPPPATAAPTQALPVRAGMLRDATRILSRWRGGQIDIRGGVLHLQARGGSAFDLTIRHAQLRRVARDWGADALVVLPESLGAEARLVLQLHGDPSLPELTSGTLAFDGQRLEFSGWRQLAPAALRSYLPQAGRGNLQLHASFARGRIESADGALHAAALEWGALASSAETLALRRVAAHWRLTRRGAAWHLAADTLELGDARAGPAALQLDSAVDGSFTRGRLQHAPVAAVVAVARWAAPQLPLAAIALDGEVQELNFDWRAHHAPGARLLTTAQLADLTVASADHTVQLSGLTAHLAGADDSVVADLQAPAAHLRLVRAQAQVVDQLEFATRLMLQPVGGGWQLRSDDLEVRRGLMSLAATGSIAAAAAGGAPRIDAHVALKDADIALLARVLGADTLATLGSAARLTAGRIESADFVWRGPLDTPAPWNDAATQFVGELALRDASLAALDPWPAAHDIDARIAWRGSRGHALIARAASGSFQLSAANLAWDSLGTQPLLRFTGRLAGNAQEALAWLRAQPQLAAWAPAVGNIDLRGETVVDLDVTQAAARGTRAAPAPRARIVALLDGDELRPVVGLPPLAALRGTLAFADGHLQHSTLTGQWLGGPVSLGVGERREHGVALLAISGRGVMDARQALLAAGGRAEDAQLSGSTEWSAALAVSGGAEPSSAHWQLRADSNLVGLASQLPQPLAKAAAATLPLHLELQGSRAAGQLQLSLGERLQAVAALARSADSWRIERGALRLAASAPALPAEPVVELDGRVASVDLAACLALWRQASRDAALPPLRAHLYAAQLLAGARSYPEVSVVAQASGGGGALQLQSSQLAGLARWPAHIDSDHPAMVHLANFDLAQPADVALAAALAAVLAPHAELSIDALSWQGRQLGGLHALLAAHGDELDVSELKLSGAAGEAKGQASCAGSACRVSFSLDSLDAAATLAAFGLRRELTASRASLGGELHWSAQAAVPLATLGGRLHMELEEGATQLLTGDAQAAPFALLSVPALLAAMAPDNAPQAPGLQFARLAANYELHDGEATTTDLHFDGDAEILMRGRVGLVAGDYDEEAWVLHGEQRLPAAVRRFVPTPRVAAAWLSLRELFAGAERTPAALRLRGTWNDPIVTPAEER
jgi:uncharacterized protein YhdP